MKVSFNWLRELVELKPGVTADSVAQQLTLVGLEVESIERRGRDVGGVVIAEVRGARPHPGAEKLTLVRVVGGGGEQDDAEVVCGAKNVPAPGGKVAWAPPGATLPGGRKLERKDVRGVSSPGMLCSEVELGISEAGDGILILSPDAPVGAELARHVGLLDEVLEVNVTPNRPDALSHVGIAREVAALFRAAWRMPAPEVASEIALPAGRGVDVQIRDAAGCPRYNARVITALTVGPSPLAMRVRLAACGMRSISNLVDVTNYVMLETGHPLHAFDLDKLRGGIHVRRANRGERMTTLDGVDRPLQEGDVVIADDGGAIALAGVMGGADSEISAATTGVLLETATFDPRAIRRTAKRLGLHSEASHRFERGVDAELPRRALERAAQLITQVGGKAGAIVEAVAPAHLPQRLPIVLRRARIERLLGIEVPDREVARILTALGMKIETTVDGWRALPPPARFDLAIEADLIEEIARIHGYDRIPTHAPRGELDAPRVHEDRVDTGALRRQLAARDYDEAITYAFVGAALLDGWGLGDGAIALANPLSADMAVMRTSLLPGLVGALTLNLNRQRDRVRLFELGRVFRHGPDGPRETVRLAGVACGTAAAEQWGERKRRVDFFDVKGDVESLLALTDATAEFEFAPGGAAWLHPGQSATIRRDGRVVGHLGAVHPERARAIGLETDTFVFELDVEPVQERRVPRAAAVSKFPSVRRDIAVLVPESVPFGRIEAVVRAAVGPDLAQLLVFDQYSGENLGSGVKSLAIGLILQNSYRTLIDADADQCVTAAVAALTAECQARLRG